MVTFLTIIHIAVSVLLIIIVLIQQGKGAEAGMGLGGNTQSVFGTRGTATALSKLTTGAAVVFMLTSLSLAYLSARQSSSSLLKGEAKPAVTPTVVSQTPAAADVVGTPTSPTSEETQGAQ